STPPAPPAAGGGAAAAAAAGLSFTTTGSGLNILDWQRPPLPLSHTVSQLMNSTVLPLPASPPRRRRMLLPSDPASAAKDQSGSGDAAMMSTFTPSHAGALRGSVLSTATAASMPLVPPSDSSTGGLLRGPVTESNGFRSRMPSAL